VPIRCSHGTALVRHGRKMLLYAGEQCGCHWPSRPAHIDWTSKGGNSDWWGIDKTERRTPFLSGSNSHAEIECRVDGGVWWFGGDSSGWVRVCRGMGGRAQTHVTRFQMSLTTFDVTPYCQHPPHVTHCHPRGKPHS
jgi:hypothetical protein